MYVDECNIYNPNRFKLSPPCSRNFLFALFNMTFMMEQVIIERAENDIISIIAFKYLGPSVAGKKNGL